MITPSTGSPPSKAYPLSRKKDSTTLINTAEKPYTKYFAGV